MGAVASQITSLMIVYSTVRSGADQRKQQSSASLAFVQGIHRWPVNSPHKWSVTRKIFPFDDVIMTYKRNPGNSFNTKTLSSQCGNPVIKIRRSQEHLLYRENPHTWKDGFVYWIWSSTHWGRMTHICFSKLTIIGSDNGLSPRKRRAIIWTNAAILSIGIIGKMPMTS